MKIAILTCEEKPNLTLDDQALVAAFSRRGVVAKPLIWSRDEGEPFDLILIRSPWDYYKRQQEFGLWLAGRAHSGSHFLNDLQLVRWNIHKFYLRELAASGLPVVDSVFVLQADFESSVNEALKKNWPRWVVKPAIGAGAFETRVLKVPLSEENAAWARGLVSRTDVLIQPFIREVEVRGELSIVVIGGEVSHVYLKKPRLGDFRVQTEFGGSEEQLPIEPWHREWAEKFLNQANLLSKSAEPIAYARVDLLPRGASDWCLSELELFEPALNLRMAPFAADQLAQITLVRAQWETLAQF